MQIMEYLEEFFTQNSKQLSRSISVWRQGISYERTFWPQWFETKGLSWKEDYNLRMTAQPLLPYISELLPIPKSSVIEILDVGSGPISNLGTFFNERPIHVRAVDPLAHIYAEIVEAFDVHPRIKTEFSFAEDLSCRFDANTIDLVNCTNSLDHSIDPAWGKIEMLLILKTGGKIILSHN